MAVKRKKPTVVTDESKSDQPRVSQVVEVVEEASPEEAVATIKKDAVEIENLAETLEKENITEQETMVVNKQNELDEENEVEDQRQQEKQKEVVDEIFHRDTSQVPLEITTQDRGGGRKKLVSWIVIVIGVALIVGGGLVVASRGGLSLPFMAAPSPTPTPAPSPTPTPAVTVNREDITIKVLNGGGVPGAGGKMKSFLEEKGYTVSEVGNTEEYTYEQTEILVKTEKQAYRKLLEEDLNDDYVLGTSAATLSDDTPEDAQVIVGKE